ncbi:tRNA (adenosine(37)-N6)-dimethylallyltransferase MiaA [Nitrospirillum sp. BR 11828]|uniref:tRNA (adenosine(37)-N6)-dimethylallyltransferase MiaA n=1 Tax=Nitrospirillum sp. BR 11828 TaxID=3104325 RepID=UPI002ACA2A77|nr:tRNA (adenosine(37)-N6)-dimethylallyltransferase MiaA [Nitrospirillum sp. BR 11828]MDZ5646215.1 tRNA (adenosine(37)-N6)-dimethylallyltransferase MiaA [Nitrospirillum sp. BR 11828]
MVVIGGPTASGKSRLALDLAVRLGGTVINADSMQIYQGLALLTAQPGAEDRAQAPHRLYGTVPPSQRMSAAHWRDLALAEVRAAERPILVGGTGLYLRTLMAGIADIPAIEDSVRERAKALHAKLGGPAFHQDLAARDPQAAARLAPGDTQRLVRAWEVVVGTGRTLGDWQRAAAATAPADLAFHTLIVDPPRDRLYANGDARFLAMMGQGALDEVRALLALGLDPDLPAMKALGVPELAAHLAGALDLEAAVALAQRHTRNYAKRQTTWFRHQMPDARRVDPGFSPTHTGYEKLIESLLGEIFAIIRKSG